MKTAEMYNSLKNRLPRTVKLALKHATGGAISSEAVHRAAHELWNEIKIARMSWASAQVLQSLRGQRDLNIHLGCGPDIRPGWVNIDLVVTPPAGFDSAIYPDTRLVSYDLRQGLPLEQES